MAIGKLGALVKLATKLGGVKGGVKAAHMGRKAGEVIANNKFLTNSR